MAPPLARSATPAQTLAEIGRAIDAQPLSPSHPNPTATLVVRLDADAARGTPGGEPLFIVSPV
jgi:hypothetical protein